MTACSAYQARSLSCANGFVQVPNCWNPRLCGCGEAYAGAVPPCLLDSIPEHLSRDDGSPLLFRPHMHPVIQQ